MDRATLDKYYLRWLKGEPLRAIARSEGIRHQKIDYWFRKVYGKQSTNLVANSLVRSMLKDYPNSPEVLLWVTGWANKGLKETDYHRSNHSISQLTQFQTMEDPLLMDIIAVGSEPENQDSFGFLRLPLFILMTNKLASDLLLAMFQFRLSQLCQDLDTA